MCGVNNLPVIDVKALLSRSTGREAIAAEIGRACQEQGFFYIVGHGVDGDVQARLEHASREFFARDHQHKLAIAMERGGRAWRGYFPVGGELTSSKPDQKEGLYFGEELGDDHPLVQARTPLHGPNLFPEGGSDLRDAVLEYMAALTRLGHVLMEGIALSLGLDASYFSLRYTGDPLILFRIFHYPPVSPDLEDPSSWGVGEHTDYGLLTILRQDATGGLQVKIKSSWMDVTPLPGSFVCNLGDMLDRMTGGLYRSTPHRVRSPQAHGRLSFPFFFDPNFAARIQPIEPRRGVEDDRDQRWDKVSVHTFRGTYGEYLLDKVSKVFPELGRESL
jgi:isopenicillin N synthase-like dioxygenase